MELQNSSKIGASHLDRRRLLTDGTSAKSKQTFVHSEASAKGSDPTLGRSKQVILIFFHFKINVKYFLFFVFFSKLKMFRVL